MTRESAKRAGRGRIWFGLLAIIAGLIAWGRWSLLHPEPPSPRGQPREPFVQLAAAATVAGSEVLREKAELLDPTPLFFPTEWNFGQRPLEESRRRQPGQFFGSFEPKLTVVDQSLSPYGLEAVETPESLADVLAQGNEAPFAGMGQVDLSTSNLPVRAGYLEVRRLGASDLIIGQALTGISPPRPDYGPMEFLVLVGPAGLVGDPILTSGSGWDEVDSFFRSYLAKSYHLGQRLAPGRYRVLVGA